MQRLLGPHLLQPASTFQGFLTAWRPPVCVVFMDHAFTDDLANRLKYSTHEAGEPTTHAQVADLKEDYLCYEKRRLELAGTAYDCGLYAFANANPPLRGSPHDGQQLYEAATPPALPHEFAHWRDTDSHGLATVLAEANQRNQANQARERRANALTQSRHAFKLLRYVLLLHQYFKPDDRMDVNKGTDQAPEWEPKQASGVWWHPAPSPWLTALNKAKNVRRFEQRLYAWFKAAFPDL